MFAKGHEWLAFISQFFLWGLAIALWVFSEKLLINMSPHLSLQEAWSSRIGGLMNIVSFPSLAGVSIYARRAWLARNLKEKPDSLACLTNLAILVCITNWALFMCISDLPEITHI